MAKTVGIVLIVAVVAVAGYLLVFKNDSSSNLDQLFKQLNSENKKANSVTDLLIKSGYVEDAKVVSDQRKKRIGGIMDIRNNRQPFQTLKAKLL